MKYRVEFTAQAKLDLFGAYSWIAADSPLNAARWASQLHVAIRELDVSPHRCPVAPESAGVEDVEVRQLICGSYRVLFVVKAKTVFILHIRHGSRRPTKRDQIASAIERIEAVE